MSNSNIPLNLLFERTSSVSWVRLLSEGVIDPEKWQSRTPKNCQELKFPIEVGSLPEKLVP